LIINENELRHEMRDKKAKIETIANLLVRNFKIKTLIVTRGNQGAFMVRNKKIIYCPAFAGKVVDKVGAGDTMLAIISLCIKMNLPDDLTLFLGSLAGSFSVENMANSRFLDKEKMLRQIESLLK
jgi:bifunctional ADP-heptose synthase (sugar kinase/adenylyltransferase)